MSSMNLAGVQSAWAAADADHEVAQESASLWRVPDLGVELHAIKAPGEVANSRRRAAGPRQSHETRGQLRHVIAVAHPDVHLRRQAGQQRRLRCGDRKLGVAVLVGRRLDAAAQVMRQKLHPVAYAKHRPPRRQDLGGKPGAASSYTLAGPPDRI